MRSFKGFALISAIVLLSLLCSCVKGGTNLNIEISPTDKSLVELSSKTYDKLQLLEILNFEGSINELNAKYPVECIRLINETYRISYLGDESVVVLLFDYNGNKILGNIYSTRLLKSDLRELEKGQSLEAVRAIDPNGEYLFMSTGRNDIPKASSHYTRDGYLIIIEYNDSNNIENIREELI